MHESAGPGETYSEVMLSETMLESASLETQGAAAKPSEEAVGYRGPTACTVAGITYRQLDYWARTGLVVPSVRDASGSGRSSSACSTREFRCRTFARRSRHCANGARTTSRP